MSLDHDRLKRRWDQFRRGFEELGSTCFDAFVEDTYAGDQGAPLFDLEDAKDIERLDAILTEGVRIVRDALQRKGKL